MFYRKLKARAKELEEKNERQYQSNLKLISLKNDLEKQIEYILKNPPVFSVGDKLGNFTVKQIIYNPTPNEFKGIFILGAALLEKLITKTISEETERKIKNFDSRYNYVLQADDKLTITRSEAVLKLSFEKSYKEISKQWL